MHEPIARWKKQAEIRCLPDETPELDTQTVANDVHSKLNSTRHKEIIKINSAAQVQKLLTASSYRAGSFSIAGGRHSMGGQQFLSDGFMLDTSRLNAVVDFCSKTGLITVQSGMLWGDLVRALDALNKLHDCRWSIVQKPTGADDISIGGSLSSNIHGRVLGRKPFVADIEKFTAIMADGKRKSISRSQDKELFSLAVGGYGLFCFVEDVTIRLNRSKKLVRKVELIESNHLMERLSQLIKMGAQYGDFQFCIDGSRESFLTSGILSTYHEISDDTTGNTASRKLSEDEWRRLLRLAHADKEQAFAAYSRHYQLTDGQIYCSDDFQLSLYVPDYHDSLEHGGDKRGSEMITELYVPRSRLHDFLTAAKAALRRQQADVIYGTVRLIEKDDETFLAWAKENYACIIFNLHVNHDQVSILRAKHSFRTLIDIALSMGGSYYLTYHRYATREQLLGAYPQFQAFIEKKVQYDPEGKFKSNWFNQICLAFDRERAK